jgi:SAM-dependent methyltransferase
MDEAGKAIADNSDTAQPGLYGAYASWWPLLSTPADYEEEAVFVHALLQEYGDGQLETMLELGSGGGNNASYLKAHYTMTLVDLAPGMLAVSRQLNPECAHVEGDMRDVRLGRQFDVVFVHDAIMYMTTETALRAAMATAAVHCRPGGLVLFVPDCVRETFKETTGHHGHDGDGRALRALEWTYDPDAEDTWFITAFAYLLRAEGEPLRANFEEHQMGLFPRALWVQLLEEAGFAVTVIADQFGRDLFLGKKRAEVEGGG